MVFDLSMITEVLDSIPKIIEIVRNLLLKVIDTLKLPEQSTFMVVVILVSLVLAYFWIKQFVVYSVFSKFSTFLNWLLLGLVIYLLIAYI